MNTYRNEEHVRVGIVLRLLGDLGWNVWDPSEVCCEYFPVRGEDRTRVDVALLTGDDPWVFVEVKAVGLLEQNLSSIETQMRDYNRNMTAMFSVATDGRVWRFYYSQTSGDFSQKLFKTINLSTDDLDDVEVTMKSILSKESIQNGTAEGEAKEYLQFNRKQRFMDDAMLEARRAVTEPPYPSLPEAIASIVKRRGFDVSKEEAVEFIGQYQPRQEKPIEKSFVPKERSSSYREMLRNRSHRDFKGNESIMQIFEVVRLMYKGHSYSEAARTIAQNRQVHVGTIRDKCTRQLAINTDEFITLTKNRTELVRCLKSRFPENSDLIDQEFRT